MAGANQLLPGFNHNVTHRGRQYHVQTEDSGTANPHVITHLFLGGNVLSSKKTSYADLVSDGGDLTARVRQLMETQHKDMLRQLVRGAFDADAGAGAGAGSRAFQPGEIHVVPATPAPPADTSSSAELASPDEIPEIDIPLIDISMEDVLVEDAPPEALSVGAPEPASASARGADGWGPPVLPRTHRAPPAPILGAPPAPPAPEPGGRRLDELILSYLAGDLAAKQDGR